ncbi:competence type IV pilus minor pilin ComGE [Anaerococcus prevotii]|uniref:Prepilin-type cleavage/methylation N-terminal domain protein n=1 Tax=Anaerococcus prevotii ACS-065-V-Col13 TaxID=879305 RepID=F0GWK4_9FIRM|nr:competence type IV pilus minor pilin ComGE [Anaerococcus prevotii]EGC81798.1 prepilin-type cleavage/methylation N-terminal domain protein [Anaerococcus prevotii ACS-065-V-Col13]
MCLKKRSNNKKLLGFTLIECLIALALLAIITVSLMPSLSNIYRLDVKNKEDTRLIYAMEEALERSKDMDVGEDIIRVNNFDIEVSVSDYEGDLKKIVVTCDGYSLDLVK